MGENKTTITCPNCAGRGHTLAGAMMLGGPVLWALALFERRDGHGVTRETCWRCDGDGFVEARRG